MAFLLVLWGACGNSAVAAGESCTEDSIDIREDNVNYTVTIHLDKDKNEMVHYAKDVDCGNAQHATKKGQRRFSHFHVNYALPRAGLDKAGNTHTVTVDSINALYNFLKGDGNRVSNADHTYNCFGYTLGFLTWVDDPSYIYADDHEVGVIVKGNYIWLSKDGKWVHVQRISKTCEKCAANKNIAEIIEKDGQGGGYKVPSPNGRGPDGGTVTKTKE